MQKANAGYVVKMVLALSVLATVAGFLLIASAKSPAHASTGTLVVNSTADLTDLNTSDGICDADAAAGNLCTLRAAIQEANFSSDFDVIDFNIPGDGVHTIAPVKELPTITKPVLIDGYSQHGASPNTAVKGTNAVLKIELNGANESPFINNFTNGLTVNGGGTTIRGLVINGFIREVGSDDGTGIKLLNVAGNTNNTIAGNFIGTNADGTAAVANQGTGIVTFFQSTGNTIGGTSLADRNLISGNVSHGVALSSSNNKVQNNLIGTDRTGTKAIGNGLNGVGAFDPGNLIGGGSPNTIAFNKASGVLIDDPNSLGNKVLSNSNFSNGDLGIDLGFDGPTPNDPGDADTGANNLQNKPVLTSARTVGRKTIIKGKLNSGQGAFYTIQFFSNPKGTNGGKKLIGEKVVSTDSGGNASFRLSARRVKGSITATATKNFTNETSEFSGKRKVIAS